MVLLQRPYHRLLLAVVWMMLSESYSLAGFVTGFIMATVVFALFAAPVVKIARINFGGVTGFGRWLWSVLHLLCLFLWEVIRSNHQVGQLAFRPRLDLAPAVVAMPLQARTKEQVTLLVTLVTLTPGTLVLDVTDEPIMYIHTIDATDFEEVLRAPRQFEKLVMEVLR